MRVAALISLLPLALNVTLAAAAPPQPSGKVPREAKPLIRPAILPDLIVKAIWLDERCDLHLTVANQGGRIPDSVWSAGSTKFLEVKIDDSPGTDCRAMGAELQQPGGEWTFTYPNTPGPYVWQIEAGQTRRVSAHADRCLNSSGGIRESNESNNHRDVSQTCTPRIKVPPRRLRPVQKQPLTPAR